MDPDLAEIDIVAVHGLNLFKHTSSTLGHLILARCGFKMRASSRREKAPPGTTPPEEFNTITKKKVLGRCKRSCRSSNKGRSLVEDWLYA